jgi:hypothetical protein
MTTFGYAKLDLLVGYILGICLKVEGLESQSWHLLSCF